MRCGIGDALSCGFGAGGPNRKFRFIAFVEVLGVALILRAHKINDDDALLELAVDLIVVLTLKDIIAVVIAITVCGQITRVKIFVIAGSKVN